MGRDRVGQTGFGVDPAESKVEVAGSGEGVMRLKRYSIRTERCYCDWIRRYVRFPGMRCPKVRCLTPTLIRGRRAEDEMRL